VGFGALHAPDDQCRSLPEADRVTALVGLPLEACGLLEGQCCRFFFCQARAAMTTVIWVMMAATTSTTPRLAISRSDRDWGVW
jgi:hypothetical protein